MYELRNWELAWMTSSRSPRHPVSALVEKFRHLCEPPRQYRAIADASEGGRAFKHQSPVFASIPHPPAHRSPIARSAPNSQLPSPRTRLSRPKKLKLLRTTRIRGLSKKSEGVEGHLSYIHPRSSTAASKRRYDAEGLRTICTFVHAPLRGELRAHSDSTGLGTIDRRHGAGVKRFDERSCPAAQELRTATCTRLPPPQPTMWGPNSMRRACGRVLSEGIRQGGGGGREPPLCMYEEACHGQNVFKPRSARVGSAGCEVEARKACTPPPALCAPSRCLSPTSTEDRRRLDEGCSLPPTQPGCRRSARRELAAARARNGYGGYGGFRRPSASVQEIQATVTVHQRENNQSGFEETESATG
ncbi:LOW QUALITY PROTEIN: hypothetical protein CVT26_004266 [Gymnopilus dilepis]|uniref:Uncharacterized protein n=1 Tax=Gymnopilus dilepis TaxID=231916 RepID=A0A409WYF5_9AGAR|nr:LOW QUALITY PROTEIN: hypothetical protein CVT26_004266 [Gymnopilus dilepis]